LCHGRRCLILTRTNSEFLDARADYAVGAAECAADLKEIIQAWPTLPADLKADIATLVRQATRLAADTLVAKKMLP